MTTVYEKAPLAFGTNTNIRLIQLLPSPATCAGQQPEIKCKFHVLPLTQDVTYTAISYMWGQDDASIDIELDGARFDVRPNLFQLLLTLSRSESCPDLLWVDAICINQVNVHERTHQVGLMGQIYSQAAGVTVWMGHGDVDISKAINHLGVTSMLDKMVDLNYTTDFLSNVSSFSRLRQQVDSNGSSPRYLSHEYFLGLDNANARQLLALCRHPYWSRVWIVQEIFLAKNVCIQYSNSCLDNIDKLYSRIQTVSSWLKPGVGLENSPNPWHALCAIPESPAAKLLAKRSTWQMPIRKTFIIPWDEGFRNMGCVDVRDRVYAMSALMDPKLAIVPDYSKSAFELFESIFEEHLKRNGTFSGPIWNLQSMLELEDKEPIVQRAKQHGSPEWLSTGILAAYGRDTANNGGDRSPSRSRVHQGSDDDALARMRLEWSEQTRRRRAAKITRARASNDGQ